MMDETHQFRTFPATVRYRTGKEGRSAYVTLPLAVRRTWNLKEGWTVWLQVIAVDEVKLKEEKK
jgi:hypothetical protein